MREHEDMLTAVTARVEQLLEVCRRLREENHSLRQSQEHLVAERAALMTRNEQARSRVETMIVRLKSLEQNSV